MHKLSHPGVRATIKLMAKRFCWRRMNKDVRKWARSCVSCQKSKVIRHNEFPLGSYKTLDARFDHVHLDLVGPLPDSNGYTYLLTCVERFTRCPEAVPIKEITAETVARTFVERWVANFGCTSTINTDREFQFESELFPRLTKLLEVTRLLPFSVFIIVPFMEFLIPFYVKFFPFMLPSTFKDKSTEANAIKQRLKAKLELTHFLQETLMQTAGAIKSSSDAPTVAEFQEFIKKVQKSGEQAQAKDITRFSKLFEDQVTLDSLDNKQLRMLCRLLSLPTIGPSHLLRFQIWIRVRQLKAEDKLIANEGVDQIPPWELQSLCQERGMRSVGLPKEKLQSQLSEWLDLHLEKNVPITLLLFSRALHVTQALVDQNPLQQVRVLFRIHFDLVLSELFNLSYTVVWLSLSMLYFRILLFLLCMWRTTSVKAAATPAVLTCICWCV
ncbi:unnamed protein product [Schistosoma margrebowiei]|uniref:Uncharacterized protein n=1 Tax=Schistosoma margrebowiei TaxID=48269 RepID=A0A183MLP0_9TREM|nr:unnamed protein product [Schistosoma margrebowiei]